MPDLPLWQHLASLSSPTVVGRFAPSPTGPLHFGSLVAAAASYIAAKAHGGRWLLRIEDLDHFRCKPQFTELIIASLAAHGFEHDGEVLQQSQRYPLYQAVLAQLSNVTFLCQCTRKQILAEAHMGSSGPIYPGHCRELNLLEDDLKQQHQQYSIRARVNAKEQVFNDAIVGEVRQNLAREVGDFHVQRSDGVYAYHLAVVVDDEAQGVNQVVRGEDLLDSTARQNWLRQLLGYSMPHYAHTPLVLGESGDKLSKMTGAQGLDDKQAVRNLVNALHFLGATHLQAGAYPSPQAVWAAFFKTS